VLEARDQANRDGNEHQPHRRGERFVCPVVMLAGQPAEQGAEHGTGGAREQRAQQPGQDEERWSDEPPVERLRNELDLDQRTREVRLRVERHELLGHLRHERYGVGREEPDGRLVRPLDPLDEDLEPAGTRVDCIDPVPLVGKSIPQVPFRRSAQSIQIRGQSTVDHRVELPGQFFGRGSLKAGVEIRRGPGEILVLGSADETRHGTKRRRAAQRILGGGLILSRGLGTRRGRRCLGRDG
jgi:hypothetical protein